MRILSQYIEIHCHISPGLITQNKHVFILLRESFSFFLVYFTEADFQTRQIGNYWALLGYMSVTHNPAPKRTHTHTHK